MSIMVDSRIRQILERISRGIHGLAKVLLGPARHTLPLYALRTATPCDDLMVVSGVACSHLTTPLDIRCRAPLNPRTVLKHYGLNRVQFTDKLKSFCL